MNLRIAFVPVGLCLALAACTAEAGPSPSAEFVSITKADGSTAQPFYQCKIERGEGEGFFRFDTLNCEGADWGPVILEVKDSTGSHIGSSLLFQERLSTRFPADKYPLTFSARSSSLEDIAGFRAVTIISEAVVDSAEALSTAMGPDLGLEFWDVEIATQVGTSSIKVQDYELRADGFQFRTGGAVSGTTTVSYQGLARADEPFRTRFAVAPNTDSLSLHITDGRGEEREFVLTGPGSYTIAEDDIVPGDVQREQSDKAFMVCLGGDTSRLGETVTQEPSTCRFASGLAEIVSAAAVVIDGQVFPIDVNGEELVLPEGVAVGADNAISYRVTLTDAWMGLGSNREFEAPFAVDDGGFTTRVGYAPFSWIRIQAESDFNHFALFSIEDHEVRFTSEINGSFSVQDFVSVNLPGDVFIAVSPGVSTLTGDLVLYDSSGGNSETLGFELEGGNYFLDANGFTRE